MPIRLSHTILAVALFALVAPTAHAAGGSAGATLECGMTEKQLAHHKISYEQGGDRLRLTFAASPTARPELVLDIDLEALDGGAVKKQLRSYRLTATCSDRSWRINRTIGTGPREHDDFKGFEVSYRPGGTIVLYNQGSHQTVSWNIALHAPMK